MGRSGKIIQVVLGGFLALASAVLLFTFLMSDKLTKREAAERIAAADEPCRAAYAGALDLQEAGADRAGAFVEAARAGEPVCRASFETLDAIIIFIPSKSSGEAAREKKAAIKDCAALSRARADLLAHFARPARQAVKEAGSEAPGLDALNAALARSDEACKAGFARLAE